MPPPPPRPTDTITLALAGDVMTGRAIDQVLPHPCDPALREPWITSAMDYVRLAEEANGPIPAPVDFSYVWGDALGELDRRAPDLRIVNLETSVTRSEERAAKGIHYRMSPENLPVLTAAGIDACSLANNHVLDLGIQGLEDTLHVLETAGLASAGAGRDHELAHAPAALPLPGGGRLLLFARGVPSSGVSGASAAGADNPGVAVVPTLSRRAGDRLIREIDSARAPDDIVVVSLHWGPNWGYGVARRERAFARRLVEEGGVDVVYGHSSHHPRPLEIHGNRPILYGCGDFVNDYEGIGGHEGFRPDLVALYLVTLRRSDRRLLRLEIVPFRIRRFRLERAPEPDAAWLRDTLNREARGLEARMEADPDEGVLRVAWDVRAG